MEKQNSKTRSVSKGRVLVTGGAGYIGSHAVQALCDAGYTVTVVDNLSAGAREAVDKRAEFVQLDLGDEAALAKLFGFYEPKNEGKSLHVNSKMPLKDGDVKSVPWGESVPGNTKIQDIVQGVKSLPECESVEQPRFDAVMHFAGNIEVGLSMKEPARFFENNVLNGVKLLEAMRAGGVQQIIFSSTAAVYGNPASDLITESDPLEPTNFYGLTKLQFEGILSAYTRLHGFRYVALRYFNAAGLGASGGGGSGGVVDDSSVDCEDGPVLAERHDPETHLIPLLMQAARRAASGEKGPMFQMYGDDYPTPDGTCIRDYIHVVDLVDAHVKALSYLLQGGESVALNLGNGKGFSVKEVMEAARAAWGVDIPFEVAPRREGDPAVLVADARRARDILAWKPQHGLPEILKSVWTDKS